MDDEAVKIEAPGNYGAFTQEKIEEMRQIGHSIESVDFLNELPAYKDFFKEYLIPNKLCILSSKVTENWKSRRDWVDGNGNPNLTFLEKHFGKATVPVADCGDEKYSSHTKKEMTLQEYIEYWKKYSSKEYPADEKCLYLKDWHFTRQFPEYQAYEWPLYFRSDWLNEYWDVKTDTEDDYRFVYMGPKGSWTPFHSDVMRSYSWSANICGRKKWIFFPPGEEENLKDELGNLAYDLTDDKMNDERKYSKVNDVKSKFIIYQNPGEVVFVPSGWHHQVFNMEDTISINHNWMNGCNIDLCWNFIKMSLEDVEREIKDCESMEGWAEQCQLILKASSGIDFLEFYNFLHIIAKHRCMRLARLGAGQDVWYEENQPGEGISELENEQTRSASYLVDCLSMNHCLFDLNRIKHICEDMTQNPDFQETAEKQCHVSTKDLLEKINCMLESESHQRVH